MTTRKVLLAGGIQGDQFSIAAYYTGVETPKGLAPVVVSAIDHPILRNIDLSWPHLLGFNEGGGKTRRSHPGDGAG